jgi:hypothetical protein
MSLSICTIGKRCSLCSQFISFRKMLSIFSITNISFNMEQFFLRKQKSNMKQREYVAWQAATHIHSSVHPNNTPHWSDKTGNRLTSTTNLEREGSGTPPLIRSWNDAMWQPSTPSPPEPKQIPTPDLVSNQRPLTAHKRLHCMHARTPWHHLSNFILNHHH